MSREQHDARRGRKSSCYVQIYIGSRRIACFDMKQVKAKVTRPETPLKTIDISQKPQMT